MNKDEIIAALKAAIANNSITLEEIAAAVGLENKLRKNEDEQAEELKEDILEVLELPPETPVKEIIEKVEETLKQLEEVGESVVEVAANELAGGKKLKNADGTEVDNPMYLYARDKLKGLRGTKLKNSVEELKKDQIMISLRSKQADPTTNVQAKEDGSLIKKVENAFREV